MFAAVSRDFAACSGVEVVADISDRFEAALVIAPEMDGILTDLVRRIESRGDVRMLSPSSTFCAWASDKTQVAATLHAAAVPVPRGTLLQAGEAIPKDFPRPLVRKPNDGCGSQGVQLVEDVVRCGPAVVQNSVEKIFYRIEEFVPGRAVSVALIGGAAGVFSLPACAQRLSDDGTFGYFGGACPLEPKAAARAKSLALRAAAAIPEWCGYIGFDLVLGPADDGSQDYLIEVNPRLTTSYVGLRACCETNLAAAMLDVIAGRVPNIVFRNRGVSFDSDGTVRYV